jgi:hypothetical protein
MMIPAPQAMAIAQSCFAGILLHDDSSMIGPWREAVLGDPILVRTVELKNSFWIVPVERPGQALGYISIGPDGRVMGYAYLYHNPADLSVCPALATRISAEEARELADDLLKAYGGARFSDPVFVHDGPTSRLAWMIEVRAEDELVSRVFVTPGYAYERRIGDEFPPPGWRGGLA